ncbi:MAG: tetratricopeptide (TPR) repeat protein [Myxococcota bacterium]
MRIGVLLIGFALGFASPAVAQEVPSAVRPASEALASGDTAAAAMALLDVLDSARQQSAHGAAWAMLGDLLAGQAHPQAATVAYANAFSSDTTQMQSRLPIAIALAQQAYDLDTLGRGALAGDLAALSDSPARSTLAVSAAKAAIQQGDMAAAIAATDLVSSTHDAFVDARIVRGIALSNQQSYGDALASLLIADAAVGDDIARQDWVKVNLARTYYAAENPLKAIEHYVQVSRGGDHWIHAHWERAWAHFVVDDMAGTLSLLRAYQTPFLDDVYLAEGDMLRIYAMFLMCKFPSAKLELDAFQARYQPLLQELDQSMITATPQSAWSDVMAASESRSLPDALVQPFTEEARMTAATGITERMDAELVSLLSADAWGPRVADILVAHKTATITREGERVLAQGRGMQTELREWLGNADLTRLDILDYETRLLERAAITGEVDLGDRLGELRGLRKRRGTRVWPGSEEVWADEVGYESVRTRSDCREDLL